MLIVLDMAIRIKNQKLEFAEVLVAFWKGKSAVFKGQG
jgi:hypothetical protein